MTQEEIKPGYVRVSDIIVDREALAKVPVDKLENARARGQRVDELCKAYISGFPSKPMMPGDEGYDPSMEFDAKYLESFKLWANSRLPELEIGERLYDDHLLITGEPDFTEDKAGYLKVVDIKCTYSESTTWKLQGAAYAYLLRANGFYVGYIEFLQLSKEGKFPKVYEYHVDKHLPMFMSFYDRFTFLSKHKSIQADYYEHL
jgi:hypothetical protein